jgi:hypothetical protein
MSQTKRPAFMLCLSADLRNQARAMAASDGISLNQFVSIALAEQMSRTQALEQEIRIPPQRYPAPIARPASSRAA